ncbi:MAG: 23S rRNA (adenine(2030)-N(6))-methyltransferase RlmJ [Aquimonas sp.]|nr:23S rRNA (adenine(2030)-N(6))-methyltransferase RlmJ [Aquimonas sp.]
MNYKHSFHAGNFADVLKHMALLGLIEALQRKEAGFLLLDTHGGRGGYLLDSYEAQKTSEAAGGILRLLDRRPVEQQPKRRQAPPPMLARYLEAIDRFDAEAFPGSGSGIAPLRAYPGSPLLAARALRPQDRLVACELQPSEHAALAKALAPWPRALAELRDGYAAVKAQLPAPERRALVLIDPPFEAQEAEYDAILTAVREGLRRMPAALFAVWFPIKRKAGIARLLRRAADLPAKSVLLAELMVRPDDSPLRMNGCGLLLVNPPYRFDQALAQTLPALREGLGETLPSARLDWLRREEAA